MPTTLTATPLPDEGAIRLVLTTPGPDWELVQLVRTDANGSRAVRLLGGAGITGGTLIHTDAEAALTGPVTYSATVSGPSRTNEFANGRPTSTVGWTPSGGETVEFVSEAEGVRLVDPVGNGGGYIIPTGMGTPGVGRWAAVGVDVKPLYAFVATNWRTHIRISSTGTGDSVVQSGAIPLNAWSRQVVSVQQTDPTHNRTQAILWPTNTPSPGQQFGARRLVIVFGDTKAEAEAAAATFFEGTVTDVQETATASVDVTGQFARAVVGPVVIPEQAVTLDPVGIETYSAQRSTSGMVTDVIGRADPVVSIGVQRTRRGRMKLWCRDYEQAKAVEAAYGRGKVMLLRQPDFPGMDMYHVVDPTGGTLVDHYEFSGAVRRWSVSVDFVETAAPLGPLLGAAAWTLADSLARNPTLLASRAEFPTLLDLAIGPTA